MNPRIKRPPYPHVTLMGKFPRGDNGVSQLSREIGSIEPFDLAIETFRIFDGKKFTVYLDPEKVGSGMGTPEDLFQACKRAFPELCKKPFSAHIGVALVDSRNKAEELVARYAPSFPAMKFNVKHVYLMKRNSDVDPFEPVAAIPLKGVKESPICGLVVK